MPRRPPSELEAAVLARDGTRQGDEIRFRCPYPESHQHGDANPSARYNPDKGAWCCDICKNGGGWTDLCGLLEVEGNHRSEIVTTYRYTDDAGQLLFEVVRKVPKAFRQRRPDGAGGWIWSMKGVRRVLYRLPEVLAAVAQDRPVHVVEGERDADNLVKLGLVATTNAGGAGKWRREYTEALSGATVVLLADNDTAGKGHVQTVTQALHGVVSELRVLELPDLPAGGDVSDWIAAMKGRGAGTEEIVAELERLVAEAEVWEPPTGEETAERAAESLQDLWALGRDPEPAAVQRVLARVTEELEGSNPLAVQTVREVAVRALKGKVNAPAKLVDAALRGLSPSRRRPRLTRRHPATSRPTGRPSTASSTSGPRRTARSPSRSPTSPQRSSHRSSATTAPRPSGGSRSPRTTRARTTGSRSRAASSPPCAGSPRSSAPRPSSTQGWASRTTLGPRSST